MDAKKQTALKHFLTGIYDLKIIKLDDNDKINQLSDLYHEAIAMEKHQIMDAWDNGMKSDNGHFGTKEQYYTYTYNI
jgi:hypothetical protein